MKVLKAYKIGFGESIRSPKMIFLIYFFNLITAVLIAIPFYSALSSTSNNSLELNTLLKGFNFDYIVDVLNESAFVFKAILSQLKWFLLASWLISLFLTGGILRTVNKDKFTISDFFAACGRNFLRFLGSATLLVIIQLLWAIAVYLPLYLLLRSVSGIFSSEYYLYIITGTAVIIHSAGMMIFLITGDFAKFYLFLNNSGNIFRAVGKALQYVFQKIHKTFSLYILLMIMPLSVFYLYMKISSDIGMTTLFGILIMFLIQQIFIIFRVWVRIWFLASQFEFYAADFISDQRLKLNREIFEELDKKALELSKQWQEEEVKNN